MRLRTIIYLVLLGLAGLPSPARTQGTGRSPFSEIHARLVRAADVELGAIRSAPVSQPPKRLGIAPTATITSVGLASRSRNPALSVSLSRVSAVQARLLEWGVDAARIFVEEGVPLELLVVAEVESGFNPLALSPKGARGTWQLMPATALQFGLRMDERMDERIHPERATRAAARYLRELYSQFDDWWLALAAYNAGARRVTEAIERSGTRDFQRLAKTRLLPEETRRYVLAVLAESDRH